MVITMRVALAFANDGLATTDEFFGLIVEVEEAKEPRMIAAIVEFVAGILLIVSVFVLVDVVDVVVGPRFIVSVLAGEGIGAGILGDETALSTIGVVQTESLLASWYGFGSRRS